MANGILVKSDQSRELIDVELTHVHELVGGSMPTRTNMRFNEAGREFTMLYNADAREEGASPNPAASLARMHGETSDSSYLLDPARAVFGAVVFVAVDGGELGESDLEEVDSGITAAHNYAQDNPEEYRLWNAAARNMGN